MVTPIERLNGDDAEARTIAVVSGKGGVGKTVTTANLSLALQEMGESVVAIDCDQSASDLALQLGIHPDPDKTLQAALEGEKNVLEAISLHPSGLMVMPSSHAIREEAIQQEQLQQVVDGIDGTVIIDAPPGLGQSVYSILDVADEILVITNPEIPAVSDAVKVSEAIQELKGSREDAHAVVTKSNEVNKEVNLSEVEMALELSTVAEVPYDRMLKRSIFDQTPVIHHTPHARSAIEYRKLAAWMADTEYRPPKSARIKRVMDSVTGWF